MGVFFPNSKLHPLFTQVLHELQLSTSEEVLLEFGEVNKCVCTQTIRSHLVGSSTRVYQFPQGLREEALGVAEGGWVFWGWTLARVFSLT